VTIRHRHRRPRPSARPARSRADLKERLPRDLGTLHALAKVSARCGLALALCRPARRGTSAGDYYFCCRPPRPWRIGKTGGENALSHAARRTTSPRAARAGHIAFVRRWPGDQIADPQGPAARWDEADVVIYDRLDFPKSLTGPREGPL